MKLLYVYIDFTNNGINPDGYRGYKKCEMNFGTEDYFKMEYLAEEDKYQLHRNERPEGEKIVSGFWGDPRLYNISALVGDNGVGKTSLIHEVISCILSLTDIQSTYAYPFILILEESNKKYCFFSFLSKNFGGFTHFYSDVVDNIPSDESEKYFDIDCSIENMQKPWFINRAKLIYFSNTLTKSDKQFYDSWSSKYSNDSKNPLHFMFTCPIYDCSLTTSVIDALRRSYSEHASFNDALDTYYNFSSYREARFLFDRNQRRNLSNLKDEGFPVPCPKKLRLTIIPSLPRLYRILYRNEEQNKNSIDKNSFEKWRSTCLSIKEPHGIIIFNLCMNCIENFMTYWGEYVSDSSYSHFVLPQEVKRSAFINCLNSVFSTECEKYNDLPEYKRKELDSYYSNCKDYIHFLWNNETQIRNRFNPSYTRTRFREETIQCSILLGNIIPDDLEEFMIRFINWTRAVSTWDYFVIYDWGLSSGERNLLQLFTKLRYLLYGNNYDIEKTDEITIKNAKNTPLAERKETIVNQNKDGSFIRCDSVILFIDEADLTLHPEWQRQFVAVLAAYLPLLCEKSSYDGDIQIIMATHSPLMLGDFPAASVIYLKKGDDGFVCIDDHSAFRPFGQNLYTILKEGFFLENGAIGELARRKISNALEDINSIRDERSRRGKEVSEWLEILAGHWNMTVQYLPEGIIRSKLEEEISICRTILTGEPTQKSSADSDKLQSLMRENELLRAQIAAMKRKGEASE